jgi:uncharacterized phage protein (TIGR02218 family)
MKEVGQILSNHLSTSQSFLSCDLYELKLKSGISYYWADTDADVNYGGHTYKGDGPIITREKISTNSTVSVDKLSVTITANQNDMIGGVPVLEVAHNGGLDDATLDLRRAFFDENGKVIDCIDFFHGICEVTQGGGFILKISSKSVVQKLNIEYPNRRYYPQCPYSIYSKECGVDIKSYRKKAKVTAVTDTNTVQIDIPFEDGYYTAGGMEWISGPLAGQATQIMASQNNTIVYMSATNTAPRISDVAYIYPGCDKTPTTCKNKFNNFSRNRATPYVPLKETIR